MSFEHRNLNGLNRSILGSVTSGNLLNPQVLWSSLCIRLCGPEIFLITYVSLNLLLNFFFFFIFSFFIAYLLTSMPSDIVLYLL